MKPSKYKTLTLYKFTAPWCGPCKAFSPTAESLCEELGIKLVSIDIEAEPEYLATHNVRGVPTTQLVSFDRSIGEDDFDIVDVLVGAKSRNELRNWLLQHYE